MIQASAKKARPRQEAATGCRVTFREHTRGDHLRNAGYASCLIGQWHPGLGDGCHANGRRIDAFCGMQVGSHGDFPSPQNNPLERNGEPLMEFSSPCLIDFFTDEALQ